MQAFSDKLNSDERVLLAHEIGADGSLIRWCTTEIEGLGWQVTNNPVRAEVDARSTTGLKISTKRRRRPDGGWAGLGRTNAVEGSRERLRPVKWNPKVCSYRVRPVGLEPTLGGILRTETRVSATTETGSRNAAYRLQDTIFARCQYGRGTAPVRLQIAAGRVHAYTEMLARAWRGARRRKR
jgi:hypothetical protein